MIVHANDIKVGSILFIGGNTCVSKTIRWFLKSNFSHVAVYIGGGKLIESDFGGVKVRGTDKYIGNDRYYAEILNPPITEQQCSQFVVSLMGRFSDKYDYSLIFGHFVLKVFHFGRKAAGLFDRGDSWICSELVAKGLQDVGVILPMKPEQMTPKDLYQFLSGKEAS